MLEIFASYVVGTIVGLWLTRSYRSNVVDTVIEALIDQQFLKTRIDSAGNTEILKWNENSTSTDK
jgi:hypothetical protein|tara:strand:+ start:12760 stop:12954 length:195 start_codon:yes stop_codon:yes gene_type:complete